MGEIDGKRCGGTSQAHGLEKIGFHRSVWHGVEGESLATKTMKATNTNNDEAKIQFALNVLEPVSSRRLQKQMDAEENRKGSFFNSK